MDDIDAYPIPGFREPVSCLTHLLAAAVFAVLGYFLVRRGKGDWARTISLGVMAGTTVFLLSMSAVYHSLESGTGRYVMRQLDVAGVFALIAGTATPMHVILFRRWGRWLPLGVVWGTAITGITLRSIFPQQLSPGFGNAIFLIMGWGGLIAFVVVWKRYGFWFASPLLWGGIAYTVGVIILGTRWPVLIPGVVGSHELWHLAVLVGLAFHWRFAFEIADGQISH
jgi:channel protein (hemolysin III family)